jgi:hypothetical protein
MDDDVGKKPLWERERGEGVSPKFEGIVVVFE